MEISRMDHAMGLLFLCVSAALEASDQPGWTPDRWKIKLDAVAGTASAALQDGRTEAELVELLQQIDLQARYTHAGGRAPHSLTLT